MPWANFLIMTAANPAQNPVGMLSAIIKARSESRPTRHSLKRSIHVLIFSLSIVLLFQAAKIGKSIVHLNNKIHIFAA